MEPIILDDVPFELNVAQLERTLRIDEDSDGATEFQGLAEVAQRIGRPKALYGAAFISAKGEDSVVVEGIELQSRVLRVNLEDAHRIFVYLATCGSELDDWSQAQDDVLRQYWAEAIKAAALSAARRALDAHIVHEHAPGRLATMSPGSLLDWPIKWQRALFSLLGDPASAIGVRLTDSFLMIPNKSVSGIRFPTEGSFESCQLCPRAVCPGRRALYDQGLYDRKYRSGTEELRGMG